MEAVYTGRGGEDGANGKSADGGGKQIPDMGDAVSGDGRVKVACRLRPLSATELSHGLCEHEPRPTRPPPSALRPPPPALRPLHTHSFTGHTEIVVVSEETRTICIHGITPPPPL